MGYLAKDRLPWQRWWLPYDHPIDLWDGMLPDPGGATARFVNRGLQPLSAAEGHRARILLAEPGMGKSCELKAEIDRLRSVGAFVAVIDLGAYCDAQGLRETFRNKIAEWRASGSNEVVFALDAFDEPLQLDIISVADIISAELRAIDPSRLRLLIASRTSLWSASLGSTLEQWWGADEVVRLTVAPLTRADVEQATSTEGQDPVRFVDAVIARGAGALAARPVTLRLLLAAAQRNELPATRTQTYRLGVQALASEQGDSRRVERRREGPPIAQRMAAARRLAAVTLLTGRRDVIRRSSPSMPPSAVALDELADETVAEESLEAIYDSALLSGDSDRRTWSHHSIEEYLAATQLAKMPLPAAINLLTVPGNQDRLVPQLQEAAAWLAWLLDEAFEWLLKSHPQMLIGADLRAAAPGVEAKVAAAVVEDLRANAPLERRDAYDALAFDGLGNLVRPLLDAAEPWWRSREALAIIYATATRSLDGRLIKLVEDAAHGGPTRIDHDVDLAHAAVFALSGTEDTHIHSRLRAVLGNADAPASLRGLVLALFWPTVISTTAVFSLTVPEERFKYQNLQRQAVHAFRTAIDTGQVAARELVGWFSAAPDVALYDGPAADLAARVAYDAVAAAERSSALWDAGADLAARLVTSSYRVPWSADDVEALGEDRRRQLARNLLVSGRDTIRFSLRNSGMIRQADLAWWFDQLAADLTGGGRDGGLSARMAIDIIVAIADPELAVRVGHQAADRHTVLAAVINELFAPAAVEHRQAMREQAAQQAATHQVQQATLEFDRAKFAAAAVAGDFAAMLEEAGRGPRGGAYVGAAGPVDAWRVLDEAERDKLAAAALSFLLREHDYDDEDLGWLSVRASGILRAHRPEALAKVPGSVWLTLLPHLVTAPDTYRVIPVALTAAASHDSEATARLVVRQMEAQAGGPLSARR